MLSSHSATLQPQSSTQSRTFAQQAAVPAPGPHRSLLLRAANAVWHAMEDFGQARANRELRLLADRWEITDPALAAELRKATEFDCTSRSAANGAR